MKKALAVAAAVFGLWTPMSLVLATGPHIEPGPVQELSEDANTVASVLLKPQVKKCISEIQNANYEVTINNSTVQNIRPGTVHYKFFGDAIVGGDSVVGKVSLFVSTTEAQGRSSSSCKFSFSQGE